MGQKVVPKLRRMQTNFSKGELSPRIEGRPDLAGFHEGAKEITNFLLLRQGGAERRPGLRFAKEAKDSTRDTILINGKPVDPFLGWALTVPFNMLSRLPVLALPSGHAANGVPTGLQIVGRSYRDRDVFQAGLAYEAALGGWFTGPANRPRP